MKRKNIDSILHRLETIFPIICIGIYIEGSIGWVGIIALALWLIYKIYIGVKALERSGMIDSLALKMRRKK